MNGSPEYHKTIALYARDLLEAVGEVPELRNENRTLENMVRAILESDAADTASMGRLEGLLDRYSGILIGLYPKYPGNDFIDTLYRRVDSLRAMCRNILPDR